MEEVKVKHHLAWCHNQSSCVLRSYTAGGGERQNPCGYFTVGFYLVMLVWTVSTPLQMITVNPQHAFWFIILIIKLNPATFKSDKTDFCKSVCSDVLYTIWHVECGRAELIRFFHTVMTQLWLSADCTTWAVAILCSEMSGSCQVYVGCDAEEYFHNLVGIIWPRLKLTA